MFRPSSWALDCVYSLWYNAPAKLPAGALYHKLKTQSSALEDGQNYRPKLVELIEIINKIIIVTSTWLFILLYQWCTVKLASSAQLYTSMTATVEGGEWSAARPSRTLPPRNTRYPFYRKLGGPQGRSGRAENLVPTGIRSQTIQPVVSRYTDWANRVYLVKIDWVLNVFFFILSTTFVWIIYHSERKCVGYDEKFILVFI